MKKVLLVIAGCLLALTLDAQTSLRQRMDEVSKRFDISFIHESSLNLDYECRSGELLPVLEDNLREMFGSTSIKWSVRGHYVSLKPAARYTLRGHVTDLLSSETLISAGVFTGRSGTITNEFGFYSITLDEGEYDFTFSYIGYETRSLHVKLDKDKVLNIALRPDARLDAAIVTGRAETGVQATRSGAIDIPRSVLDNSPVLLGEKDVLKTIQTLPGVQGGMDGFSGIFVRGGSDDENLLLLDGVPVYNAAHAFGIFSVFTPEAVKKVTLYKSDFPARYAGRASSVVDVRTNDGDMNSMHGAVTVGIMTDGLHLEGPLDDGKTSFSVSGRLVHSLLFSPLMKAFDVPANYWFYDLNGKINHRFSDKDRLYLGIYRGNDHFGLDDEYESPSRDEIRIDSKEETRMKWGNTIGTLRWNHVFGRRLFSNTTAFMNSYEGSFGQSSRMNRYVGKELGEYLDERFRFRSGIFDVGAKTDFDWNPSPEHSVRFGAAVTSHRYHPDSNVSDVFSKTGDSALRDTTLYTTASSVQRGLEASVYAEDDFSVGEKLKIDAGVHLSLFATQGKTYLSPQPRLSLRYALTDDLALKGGYARMAQYIHKLSSGNISLPTDLWVPITKDIRPLVTDQVSSGIAFLGLKGWELTAEAYWKRSENVLEYKDAAANGSAAAEWSESVATGSGRAYGVELLARKTDGPATGWLSYTWSHTDRIFRDGSVNAGKWFPYRYDRRHVITAFANYHFEKGIDFSALWTFASGGAMTLPTRSFSVMDYDGDVINVPYVETRSNYRLPADHRLDLSVNFTKQKHRGERTWNVGVYNVYARKNPNIVDIDIDGNAAVRIRKYSFLICIPSISYTYRF